MSDTPRDQTFDVFSVRKISKTQSVWAIYLLIVVGIVAHFIWETLVAYLANGAFPAGSTNPIVWLARVIIALIAGAWSFGGIWQQVQKIDMPIRYFTVFTLGFAVDALTGPVLSAAIK